jgi:hypothetical protein
MALNTFTRLIVGFSQNSSLTSHKLLSPCCKPQTHTKQKVNLEENFNWHGSMACKECCGLSRPFEEAITMASIASSFHSLQKALRKKKHSLGGFSETTCLVLASQFLWCVSGERRRGEWQEILCNGIAQWDLPALSLYFFFDASFDCRHRRGFCWAFSFRSSSIKSKAALGASKTVTISH